MTAAAAVAPCCSVESNRSLHPCSFAVDEARLGGKHQSAREGPSTLTTQKTHFHPRPANEPPPRKIATKTAKAGQLVNDRTAKR